MNGRQGLARGGFTLLEVLISLAVLIIGLASILPLYAVASASHKRGVDHARVGMIAPHIAARIQERLYEFNPKDLKDQVFEGFDRTFLYDASFRRLDPRDPAASAFFVTVTVRWSEDVARHSETFTTVMLRRLPRP